jgi:uncharacterized protein (TIGR00255 family)
MVYLVSIATTKILIKLFCRIFAHLNIIAMIKSMTGYGKASAVAGSKTITAEVRSLNSKQLDLSVKMPSAYRPAEYEMRALASGRIGRGKVDVYINVEDSSPAGGARINAALFAEYYRQICDAARGADIRNSEWSDAAVIPAILRMPEVMTSSEGTDVSDEELATLKSAFTGALEAFDAFRLHEGEILLTDILGRVDTIEGLLAEVEPFEVARIPIVKARILENIAAVGVTVDANRLEQEIVFWVEKLDITEEKVRLTKHLDYFRSTASSDEDGVGRKLGFIAQEMGREINTLGSKANDANIQQIVVRMKDELEKIKEQLLNIL